MKWRVVVELSLLALCKKARVSLYPKLFNYSFEFSYGDDVAKFEVKI